MASAFVERMEDFRDTADALSWIAVGPSRNAHWLCAPPVEEWEPGWVMFLYGPLGLLDGQVGWFANPLMLAAVLLGKHKRAATILASLAIFLATSVTSITFNTVPAKVSHLVVIRFGLGYYLWLASSISLLVVMRLSFRTISGVSGSPEGAESK
jgi:hypothetical protein